MDILPPGHIVFHLRSPSDDKIAQNKKLGGYQYLYVSDHLPGNNYRRRGRLFKPQHQYIGLQPSEPPYLRH